MIATELAAEIAKLDATQPPSLEMWQRIVRVAYAAAVVAAHLEYPMGAAGDANLKLLQALHGVVDLRSEDR